MKDFAEYLARFEKEVCETGSRTGLVGRVENVSITACRLEKTKFGDHLGKRIESDVPFAINYYGYIKKSHGFFVFVDGLGKCVKGQQIKSIQVPVVNFASIKLEKMCKLAPALLVGFANFKKEILDTRGFQHHYEA